MTVRKKRKACIPLDIAFALDTKCNQKPEKQHEIYMPNAKPALAYPIPSIFYRLTLGVSVGANANFKFCVGGYSNLSIFRYQHAVVEYRL